MKTKTIVLIHGLFMNAKSWAGWKARFEAAGYEVIVPEFPHHSGEPADLRKNIPDGLRTLDLDGAIAPFEAAIRKLQEPPILIGHSIGGLIVQILLNRGLGAMGVSIDPAPPRGVFTSKWSFIKANLPTVSPFKGNSPCLPSVRWFQYAFCNTLTIEETQRIYDEFVVPEARNIPRQSTMKAGKADWAKQHAPLLIIAGGKDNIVPASLNRSNFKKYKPGTGVCEFKEFPEATHMLCGLPGWEEIADYIKAWIER